MGLIILIALMVLSLGTLWMLRVRGAAFPVRARRLR